MADRLVIARTTRNKNTAARKRARRNGNFLAELSTSAPSPCRVQIRSELRLIKGEIELKVWQGFGFLSEMLFQLTSDKFVSSGGRGFWGTFLSFLSVDDCYLGG